ncbi:DUF3489 domain-containing protein [Sneathiella sp.]|uniref:DUF3489 domain-containing protein n=1 Tax=Sneathiella sp. TaxID=1964365 RepID=UPI00260208E8|nr:DUF3489 domain-containing protein [Sneathiella sp.]MDF2366022.1 DUF3489 domain-containing protein [Sneathiella sp.]
MTVTETEPKPEAIEAKAKMPPSNAGPAKAAAKQASSSNARKPVKPSPTKPNIILKLIKRPKGARMQDLQKATGWQAHSIRAALTGLRKKGVPVERQKGKDGISRYSLSGDLE